jgi:hypothetical protein
MEVELHETLNGLEAWFDEQSCYVLDGYRMIWNTSRLWRCPLPASFAFVGRAWSVRELLSHSDIDPIQDRWAGRRSETLISRRGSEAETGRIRGPRRIVCQSSRKESLN